MTNPDKTIDTLILVLAVAFIIGLAGYFAYKSHSFEPIAGGDFSYFSSTMATSSVGTYSWSTIVAADTSRGYASFCNDSRAANSDIYLGLGGTSSVSTLGMAGIAIPSNTCYQMTQANMFTGIIYAIASSATSTLLQVYK